MKDSIMVGIILMILVAAFGVIRIARPPSANDYIDVDKSLGEKRDMTVELELNADGTVSNGPFSDLHGFLSPLVSDKGSEGASGSTQAFRVLGQDFIYDTEEYIEDMVDLRSPNERWEQILQHISTLPYPDLENRNKVLSINANGNIIITERRAVLE